MVVQKALKRHSPHAGVLSPAAIVTEKESNQIEMSHSFRVIIAGGSVAGLTLALALEKLGIDFLILERGPVIAPQLGASLGIHPYGANMLDQLGAWNKIEHIVSPLTLGKHFDSAGNCFLESNLHQDVHTAYVDPTLLL